MAQYPYWLTLTGSVSSCYPGQTINLQTVAGTQPAYDLDIPVDPNTCSFLTTVGISSSFATWAASTQCNGQVITYADSAVFNFMGDSAYAYVVFNCGSSNVFDCAGVVNGPAMPGTPCDDGDPATLNDIYQVDCSCSGQDSIGTWDCLQIWNGPDMPGTPCDDGNPMTFGDVWTPACVCVGADTSYTDCLGVINGPNVPGTPCVDFFGTPGIYGPDCSCQTNSQADCLGNPGGGALPGTPCTYTPDSGNTWITDIWSPNCVCGPDSSVFGYDCAGVWNGPAQPGTPCTVPGTVIAGTYSADCVCEPNNPAPCEANFWVIQAMGPDSLPIPYELWVWNLSNGNVAYSWDFGDGTTSTEAYPTHTYSGNGPYNLCLTVADNNGCTDTHCDTVSINSDGIYEGMVVHAEDRQDGFTINVMEPLANGLAELTIDNDVAVWPNPATTQLNVAIVSGMKGQATVTITDLEGRLVSSSRQQFVQGRNQLQLSTDGLRAGMYTLRVAQGATSSSVRFVKVD